MSDIYGCLVCELLKIIVYVKFHYCVTLLMGTPKINGFTIVGTGNEYS